MPLPLVDWQLSDLDRRSVRVVHDLLGAEVRRQGLGRLEADLGDDSPAWAEMTDAAHHAGTTRMGLDPRTSVADSHGEVHAVRGLFVNGSSLFPTSGYANPVFTIAALALHVADRVLERVGGGPPASVTLRRQPIRPTVAGLYETRRWMATRASARRITVPASRGAGVLWPAPGSAELVEWEVPSPGANQVMVLVEASAVSPGTERAAWLARPGTNVSFPHQPGYSCSGRVVCFGPGVYDLPIGTPVAVWGSPHRSVVTVDRRHVHALPDDANLAEASLVTLGAIATFGVSRAGVVAGRRVAVIGSGPIGLLAQRLAVAAGASSSAVIASSPAKEAVARNSGGVELVRPADVDDVEADVVIEATGAVEALELAVRACRRDGRVVLLGTTRSDMTAMPVALLRARRTRMTGAHMSTADRIVGGGMDRARAAQLFIDHLIAGEVNVADLITHRVDPRAVGPFYSRQLASDRALVAAVFDWWRLPDAWRLKTGALTTPNPFRHGLGDVGPQPPDPPQDQTPDYEAPSAPRWVEAQLPPSVDEVLELTRSIAPSGPVIVLGDGAFASNLRASLPWRETEACGVAEAAAVIDAKASRRSLMELLPQVGPSSTVIAITAGDELEVDVQRHVHRTGATLVVL